MEYIPSEKAMVIRYPSTANLMLDANDRDSTVYDSPWDFQITKSNSLLNGYFTRVATTEVVLEWCYPNISADLGNTFVIEISGTDMNPYNDTIGIQVPTGFYTVEELTNGLIFYLNNLFGTTGTEFTANYVTGNFFIDASGGFVTVTPGDSALNFRLGAISTNTGAKILFNCPDLRPFRYIDFVSSQLTYAQDLKDSSTARDVKDVLCRWYFDDDVPEVLDAYGFPILMGYKQFRRRRLYNPPKQIKWEPNLPIGNLSFQVYDENGNLLLNDAYGGNRDTGSWLMTLQVSEV